MKYVIYNGKGFVRKNNEPNTPAFSIDVMDDCIFSSATEASEHLAKMAKSKRKNCKVKRHPNFKKSNTENLLDQVTPSAKNNPSDQGINPNVDLPSDLEALRKIYANVETQLLDMEKFFLNLDNLMKSVNKKISECDMAREDILHKIELAETLNAADEHYLCQLLRQTQRERRCHKDILRLLQSAQLAQCNYWVEKGPRKIIDESRNRTYTPRVLAALFEKTQPQPMNNSITSNAVNLNSRHPRKASKRLNYLAELKRHKCFKWFG